MNDWKRQQEFEKLFSVFYPKVRAFALSLIKNEDDAEDIAQEVFVRLWTSGITPDVLENPNGYLFVAARNQVLNFLRRRVSETLYQEHVHNCFSECIDFNQHDQLYAKEIELIMRMTVDRMPEQRRVVFSLSRFENLSNQEIANRLSLSVRTVERHLYLALQELKKIVFFLIFLYFR